MKTIALLLSAMSVVFFFAPSVFADANYTGCDNVKNGSNVAGALGVCDLGKPDVQRTLIGVIVNVVTAADAGSVYFKVTDQLGNTLLSCSNVSIPSTGLTAIPFSPTNVPAGNGVQIGYFSDAGCTVGGTGLVLDGSLSPNIPYAIFEWSNTTPIDFNNTTLPNIYGQSSTSTAVRGLFNGMSFASSTANCSDAGNVFAEGICAAFNFVFVPDPQILNQYATLFSTSSTDGFFSRFPASYAVGISSAFAGLSASSSANAALVVIPFTQGDVASSTAFGRILPDFTVFSTTTISKYYPDNIRNTMNGLIAFGLWLGFGTDVFFYVRNKMHRV